MPRVKRFVSLLQEFSIPLITGVFVALLFANTNYHLYHEIVHHPLIQGMDWLNLHFVINDIFMVFFFGIAAKEIVESFLPGGALSPMKKAINPLLGTIGGVVGPVGVFFLLTTLLGQTHLNQGWGIPTATDIALAWLGARLIFGEGHPAINFLLLLAIVDDAIGLGIIAIFYGDPMNPANPMMLGYVVLGMAIAFLFRKKGLTSWPLYIFIPGVLSWHGLHAAHLHPALALVFVVPFLPAGKRDVGLFADEYKTDELHHEHHSHSPLEQFEHSMKTFVDFGLFFFAFANAGVELSNVDTITWIILASLIVGKTIGIGAFSGFGVAIGIPLPEGMSLRHLPVVGMIAGLGLTVALFVTGAAYVGDLYYAQGPAKMGALFSIFAVVVAYLTAKALRLKKAK